MKTLCAMGMKRFWSIKIIISLHIPQYHIVPRLLVITLHVIANCPIINDETCIAKSKNFLLIFLVYVLAMTRKMSLLKGCFSDKIFVVIKSVVTNIIFSCSTVNYMLLYGYLIIVLVFNHALLSNVLMKLLAKF